MRKLFIPLLMASAVMPVAAVAQDRESDSERHVERVEQRREERQERPERQERSRPSFQIQQQQQQQAQPQQDRALPERSSDTARDRAFGQWGREQRSDRANEVQQSHDDGMRTPDRRRNAPLVGRSWDEQVNGRPRHDQVTQPVRTDGATTSPTPNRGGFDELRGRVIQNGDQRDDHHRWDRDRRDDHHRWDRDWRSDHRYDWRRHRDRNRFVFRIGTYFDPYRYSYHRLNIGYTLWPNYYSSRYWLNDPWMYRLPPAYGPYRWVRYYDDALLVNIYSGQVVDVLYNFFW